MKIFSSNAGTVGVISPTDGNTSPFVMRVDGAELSGDLIRGIVTSMSVSQDTSVQFMHSLRDTIYINVFGNKIGQMNISGILFLADVCDGADKNSDPPFKKFYEYYTNNNAVARESALDIQIGSGVSFKAFLLGFNFQVADAQTSLGQFTMTLAVVPKKAQSGLYDAANVTSGTQTA